MGGLGGEVGQTVSELPGQPSGDIDRREPLSENFSVADELDVGTTTGDRYGDMFEFVQGDTPASHGNSPDRGPRLHSLRNDELQSVSISGQKNQRNHREDGDTDEVTIVPLGHLGLEE